jgi:actin-related protein
VLTGGGSLLSGLSKRLHWETLTLVPAAFKPRILTAAPREREFSAWIGGSILASLGTFQQMWISKAEYDEEGPAVVERKCA